MRALLLVMPSRNLTALDWVGTTIIRSKDSTDRHRQSGATDGRLVLDNEIEDKRIATNSVSPNFSHFVSL